jgi:hypothetical protein
MWLDEARSEAARCDAAGLKEVASVLRAECAAAEQATAAVATAAAQDREAPLRVADDYLMGLSHTMLAWAFAASLRAAMEEPDATWGRGKAERMSYGLQWVVPQAAVHWARVRSVDVLALPALSP